MTGKFNSGKMSMRMRVTAKTLPKTRATMATMTVKGCRSAKTIGLKFIGAIPTFPRLSADEIRRNSEPSSQRPAASGGGVTPRLCYPRRAGGCQPPGCATGGFTLPARPRGAHATPLAVVSDLLVSRIFFPILPPLPRKNTSGVRERRQAIGLRRRSQRLGRIAQRPVELELRPVGVVDGLVKIGIGLLQHLDGSDDF